MAESRRLEEELTASKAARKVVPLSSAWEPVGNDEAEHARQHAAEHLANLSAELDLSAVLPGRLARQLIARAESFPVHPVTLLSPLLCTVAGVIGTRARVAVKKGWSEPLVIWAGNVLEPSQLKTPAANVFSSPLLDLQAEAIASHDEAVKATKASGDQEAPDPAPARRWIVSDATFERIAEVIAQPQTVGLVSFQDELSGWFATLDRSNGSSARAGWLSLWGGSASVVDRKVAASSFARHTAVSLFGNVQPEKLLAMIEAGGNDATAAADGLWCRFLWCRPPELPWRYSDDGCCISEEITHLLRSLDRVTTGTVFQLSQQAKKAATPFWEGWADDARQSSPARAAFLGKLRGYSVRIAGILHALDCADAGNAWPLEIGHGAMDRALVVATYYLAQFDALTNDMGAGDLPPDVAAFQRKVKDGGLEEVTLAVVRRWKLWGRASRSKEEVLSFLREVANTYGFGEVVQGARSDSWTWRKR